jgi:hypothetical protein
MSIKERKYEMSDRDAQQDVIGATLREAIDTATDDAGREQAREALGQHLQARATQATPKPPTRPGIPLLSPDPYEAQRQAEGRAMLEALQNSPGVSRGFSLGLLSEDQR